MTSIVMCDSHQPCLTPLPAKDIPRQGRGCVMSPRRGHHIFLLWNPTCGKFCFTMMGYTPNSVAQKLFHLTWWDSNQDCRPAEAGFTMRPQPPMESRWSYVFLNCIKTVVLRQLLDRHRFESHLGLGTFTDLNLYLFYPFFFHSLFLLKPQPYPYRHWSDFAAKNNSSLSFEYQLWNYHCLLIFIVTSILFWLLLLVSPDGGRTQNLWVPSPGPYHWATPTDEWGLKLRNFI